MQGLLRRYNGCAAARAFCQQGREAHFPPKIKSVVACRAIGAQADVNPVCEHFRDGSDAAGQFQVRTWAVADRAAVAGEQRHFLREKVNAVRGDEIRAQHAKPMQALDRPDAIAGDALVNFLPCFVQMRMDGQITLFGKGDDPAEGLVACRIGRVGSKAKAKQGFVRSVSRTARPLLR